MRLAVLSLVCALSATAQTEAFRLLPQDAPVVFGVRLKGLMASALGQQMRGELKKQVSGASPGVAGMADMMFGMLDSIDSIVLTSSSTDFIKSATGPGAKAADQPFLMIISGRFEGSGLAGLLQTASKAQPELYRGVSIFRGDEKKVDTNRLAMLDPNTLLVGDRRELTAAIDRARGVVPEAIASSRLHTLAANDFFLSMALPPGSMTGAADPKNPASKMLADVTGIDVGVKASSGLAMALDVRTKTAGTAERMSTQLQALMALGAMQANDQPEVARLAQKVTFTPGASGVRIALAMSEAEVMKFAEVMQKRAAAPAGQTAPVRTGPPVIDGLSGSTVIQTEKPQASGGIKISGLDPEPKKN